MAVDASSTMLAISVYPSRVTCSLIGHTSKRPATLPYILHAHSVYECMQSEMHNVHIFNPTRIVNFLKECIGSWGATAVSGSIVLSGPAVYETIIHSMDQAPSVSDANFPTGVHWQWNYRNVCTFAPDKHLVYVAGMPRPIIMQYHLLMRSAGISLARISTQQMSLLFLYKHLYGAIFRPIQLAEKLAQYNNQVEKLFNPDVLGRIIEISSDIELDRIVQFFPLLNACASLASERYVDEQH